MPDDERTWVNPRDGKAWRIVRAWVPPAPYRAVGSPEVERVVVPSIRFLHPPTPGDEKEALTAVRAVRGEIRSISDEEMLVLFEEAVAGTLP